MMVLHIGGGKEIGVAPIFYFETFAQCLGPEWEVAGGNMSLSKTEKSVLQFFLVERRESEKLESATRKIGHFIGRDEEM